MADFKNLTLTILGSELLEKAIAGTTLEFTRAAVGDGRVADGTDISGLTALVNEKKSIPIHSIEFKDGLTTVTIVFSNSDLSVGFQVRELGLFAKDPEKGEILYAVANAGDDSDWLPEMGSNVVEEVFKIVPVVSGATKVTAVMDSSLTYVTKEEFAAHHHVTGGQNDGEPVEAKDVVNTPSGLITATTVQESINQAGLSIAPPETDYIINSPSIGYGGKFTPHDDLSINVSALEAMIGRKYHKSEAVSDFALNPRKASVIYATQNSEVSSVVPTLGHYDAVYPEADGNTVLRYVFNEASGQIIDSSGNGNHGIVNGVVTRQVDGWADYAIKGDGSSGYITSINSTNVPIGANPRELDIVFTPMNTTSVNYIFEYGSNSNNRAFGLAVNNNGNLLIDYWGNTDSGYTVSVGQTYFVSMQYDGSNIKLYVNGSLIFTLAFALNTASSVFTLFRSVNPSGYAYSNAIIHYVELRNVLRTPQQIAAISNKLCLPCHYTGYSATYPANDATTGAHIFKFDDVSGSTVTDENGTLNGTATGTTIVDSEIGLGKARKLNGTSDYVPLGNYSFPSAYTVIAIGNISDVSSDRYFLSNYASSAGMSFVVTAGGKLYVGNGPSLVTSSISIPVGIPAFAAYIMNNNILTFCTGLNSFETTTIINSTANQQLFIGRSGVSGTLYHKGTIEYLAIIPRALSQAEIAQYYNALMVQKEHTLIDDCLPSNSISLGFARTGSSALIEYNDSDYRYMRNEGATKAEGNKRVFLGWKYFNTNGNTTVPLLWDNPLGIPNRVVKAVYKENLSYGEEICVVDRFSTPSGDYGVYVDNYYYTTGNIIDKISIVVMPLGAVFKTAWRTSGYIGCYAEVL